LAHGCFRIRSKVKYHYICFMRFTLLLLGIMLIGAFESRAQLYEETDQRPATLVDFHYNFGTPLMELADRFGVHNSLGANVHYMWANGWSAGLNGRYFFGNEVNVPGLLSNLFTSQEYVIGNNRGPARLSAKERGWVFGLTAAKIFDMTENASRTGLRVEAGMGLMWHRIRLQDDGRNAIQLFEPYHKGYDRLTGGPCGIFDIGYQYMGARRSLNFRFGINAIIANTISWRKYNYDTRTIDDQRRWEGMLNVYAAFILPIYGTNDASQIYY